MPHAAALAAKRNLVATGLMKVLADPPQPRGVRQKQDVPDWSASASPSRQPLPASDQNNDYCNFELGRPRKKQR